MWLLPLDLASLASVRACAAAFLALDEPLHVLVNNAGLGGQRGLTADGFELHFGVNHLGHYALTLLLLDRLTASGPDARIVNVSSAAHYGAPGIDFDALRRRTASFTGQREYAVSKLCNVLFTQELTRRLDGIRRVGVRAAPRRGRLRHLAAGAPAGATADHGPDADDRTGRGHLAVLRHLARGDGVAAAATTTSAPCRNRTRSPPRSWRNCCGSAAPPGPGLAECVWPARGRDRLGVWTFR